MSDQYDDLFGFGDLDDVDTLDLDLEELFGELETVSLSEMGTEAAAAGPAAAPAAATPAAGASSEAGAFQAVHAAAPASPAGSNLDLAASAPRRRGLAVPLAIAAAAIVTLANVASMAIPRVPAPGPQVATGIDPELLALTQQQARDLAELRDQVRGLNGSSAPTPDGSIKFLDSIRADIDAGDYAGAREHLYSILAAIDRHAPQERATIEAQAEHMIAQTWRLEARSAAMGGAL